MQRKRWIKNTFLVLTAVNIGIFLFRDSFQYQPYASYSQLYAKCDQGCAHKWESWTNDYPSTEMNEARQITDSIVKKKNSATTDKIILIGSYLYNRLHKQNGSPSGKLQALSPLQQYKMLCASPSEQLWCGNYAQIFSWFCWSQGIVTRTIEIMNPGDHHVLNECFIPETGQWIMTDITHNLMMIENADHHYLDLPTFRSTLKKKEPLFMWSTADSLKKDPVDVDAPYIKTYYLPDHPLYFYHRLAHEKVYSASQKIKRYMLPVSWFEILDETGSNNRLFYFKEVLLFLWLISIFVFMASRTKFRI